MPAAVAAAVAAWIWFELVKDHRDGQHARQRAHVLELVDRLALAGRFDGDDKLAVGAGGMGLHAGQLVNSATHAHSCRGIDMHDDAGDMQWRPRARRCALLKRAWRDGESAP
jgi:hypothetical protein